MRTTLILFTASYPYGSYETFLVPELPHLCQAFDRVVIMPMSGANGQRRTVPANVEVVEPLWTSPGDKLRLFARAMFSRRTWELFFRESFYAVKSFSRYHIALFVSILHWALYRSALERCDVVRDAVRSPEGIVAYSYWGHQPALAVPALAAAGIPCVVRYHRVDLYLYGLDVYGYYLRNIKYFPWREEIVRRSRRSVLVSAHGMAYFCDNWGKALASSDRVLLRRLGVPDRGVNLGRSTLNPPAFVVVSCSSITPVKRVHLIAAFVKELSKSMEVVWHHFGSGESELLQQEVENASCRLKIHLQGWVENEEIMHFYRNNHVDLFVNLSVSEGVPVSIMEAISFGIPALATDVGGTAEVVIKGESGVVVGVDEATDSKKLTGIVLEALQPDGAIKRSNPRSVWKERFDSFANFSTFAQELKRMLNA